jgi:hypothetical protein
MFTPTKAQAEVSNDALTSQAEVVIVRDKTPEKKPQV